MRIDVLVCHSDGTQVMETREISEDYFGVSEDMPEEEQAEA